MHVCFCVGTYMGRTYICAHAYTWSYKSLYIEKILLNTKKIEFSVSIMKTKETGSCRECEMVLEDPVLCILPAEESQLTFV